MAEPSCALARRERKLTCLAACLAGACHRVTGDTVPPCDVWCTQAALTDGLASTKLTLSPTLTLTLTLTLALTRPRSPTG